MKKFVPILAVAIALLGAKTYYGIVAININVYSLYAQEEGVFPTSPMLTKMVFDPDNDTSLTEPLTPDSFTADDDDVVAVDIAGEVWNFTTETPDTAAADGFTDQVIVSPFNIDPVELGTPEGTSVLLYWFPGLGSDADGPGLNQPYGVTKLGTLPADGLPFIVNIDDTDSGLIANQVAIPEPTSALAMLMAGGGLLMTRRLRRAKH